MKRDPISSVAIEREVNKINRSNAFSGREFPLNDLSDREFEILIYHLFKKRIEAKDPSLNSQYETASLMPGVGEKGRDILLTGRNKFAGIVQCKKYAKNLTKPEVAKEIVKFLLNTILDSSLLPNPTNFKYYIACSTGFASTAIEFIDTLREGQIPESELRSWVIELSGQYKHLEKISFDDIKDDLRLKLQTVSFEKIVPADISLWLETYVSVTKRFFKILTVTDNTLIEKAIELYLKPIFSHIKGVKNTEDFSFRFKEYLTQSYKTYSSAQTLVFGNQQKKLEDFYYPLMLKCQKEGLDESQQFYSTAKYDQRLIPCFKKVLIIDAGGMGKSTISKWLYLSVIKQECGIPFFIELRKLKKSHSVLDEIITQLNPLNPTADKDVLINAIAKGNFVFFLDGFDEISEVNRESVTTDLRNFINSSSNNLFLLTSRPEQALNAFGDFQEFGVKKLEQEEAYELIRKLGANSVDKANRLIDKLKTSLLQDVKSFLYSPLLVSLLYKKFEYRETIPLKKQEFFYEMFEALFQAHDLTKGDSFIREKKSKLSLSEFFTVLRWLGYYTAIKSEIEYNQTVLSTYLEKISDHIHLKFDVSHFINDLHGAVPIFNKEGVLLKWSHKSIQEYFAAEHICRDKKESQTVCLEKLFNSQGVEKYYLIFELCYDIDYRTFSKALIVPMLKNYLAYCDNSFNEIKASSLIEPQEILKRQSMTFQSTVGLIRIGRKSRAHLDNIFERISKLIGTDLEKVAITVPSIQAEYFPFIHYDKYNLLFRLLGEKKNKLITSNYTKEDLEFGDISHLFSDNLNVILIDESPVNFFNTPEIFSMTNALLSMVLHHSINHKEVLDYLAKEEKRNAETFF